MNCSSIWSDHVSGRRKKVGEKRESGRYVIGVKKEKGKRRHRKGNLVNRGGYAILCKPI